MKPSTEKALLIEQLNALMEALAAVIGRHIEVVLHDLSQPTGSVINIINGHVSKRAIGSSLLAGPDHDQGFLGLLDGATQQDTSPAVFKDYKTLSAAGTPLHSATVVYKDATGLPQVSLCINADYSAIQPTQRLLDQLLPAALHHDTSDAAHLTLEDRMNEIIEAALPSAGKPRSNLGKQAKVAAVRSMQAQGLFIVRGGVEHAAKALGVTRFTIYNYLDEIKATAAHAMKDKRERAE